ILQVLKKQDDINNDQLDLEKSQIDNKTNNFNKQGKGKLFYWIFMLWSGILFSFGIFSLVGVFIGFLLIQYYLLLNFLFGIALIIFGIIILIPKLEEITFTGIKIPESIQKYLQKESYTGLDLFVIGTIYSIIALPCSGPIFIALIPIIINYSNPILSMLSLFVFAIGLLLPYVLLISITSKTQMQFVKGIRNRYILVKNITAILLLFMGGILAWPFFGGPILFSIG
ncbi:MAG: cytochrome c biogenesis protein CcdA, partial [Candidatus Thorarchaeota archaeon]